MLKVFLSIVLFFFSMCSFSETFVEGKDYERIKNTALSNEKNSDVLEFFSLGCPWCYRLEPKLQDWLTQHTKNIECTKVPVIFHKSWEYYAKAYYIANALNVSDTLIPALFNAIIDKKQMLQSNQAMIDFFTQHGVDKNTAQSAFLNSPSIDMQVAQSQSLVAQYHINAVPAFVVHNEYKTDLQMAKTAERLFAILDFLRTQNQ